MKTSHYMYPKKEAQRLIRDDGLNLTMLSPSEVVSVSRFIDGGGLGGNDSAYDRLEETLSRYLPDADPEFASAIFNAFAESPVPADRIMTHGMLFGVMHYDHDGAIATYDRLVRDADEGVRRCTYSFLKEHASAFTQAEEYGSTMRWIDTLDEAELTSELAITRQDLYDLSESYAYAENGQYLHYVGQWAAGNVVLVDDDLAG